MRGPDAKRRERTIRTIESKFGGTSCKNSSTERGSRAVMAYAELPMVATALRPSEVAHAAVCSSSGSNIEYVALILDLRAEGRLNE